MKKCSKCGFNSLNDARFCEKCGNQLVSGKKLGVIIAALAILLTAGIVGFVLLNKGKPDEEKTVVTGKINDCNKSFPAMSSNTKKSAIVIFDTNIQGGVRGYVIKHDAYNNWELFINGNNYRSYKEMDNITPVGTFVNETVLNHAPNKTLYVYKTKGKEDSKDFLKNKISSSIQFESARPWRPDKEKFFLSYATIPHSLQDSSCMVVVGENQVDICYMKDGALMTEHISTGYQTDIELKKATVSDIFDKIPNKNKSYFFTSGYPLIGKDIETMESFTDGYFTPINSFIQKQIANGDKTINRILDIYKTIQSATGTCLFYRKDACPEIGYLLYNK